MRLSAGLAGLLMASAAAGLAFAEDITVTTYYPSPRGVYEDVAATGKIGVGTTNTSAFGAAERLKIIGPAGGAATNLVVDSGWPGAWLSLGFNDLVTHSADLNVGGVDLFINNDVAPNATNTFINAGDGNVGIGLSDPLLMNAKLQVQDTTGINKFLIGTAGTPNLMVAPGGNVGIGTNPGATPLLIASGGNWIAIDPSGSSCAGSLVQSICTPGLLTINPNQNIALGENGSIVSIGGVSTVRGFNVVGFGGSWFEGTVSIGADGSSYGPLYVTNVAGNPDTLTRLSSTGGVTINRGSAGITPGVILDVNGNALVTGEARIGGISSDGAGQVVCIKGDGALGTCDNAPDASGVCFCT